ncbi:hypothetical protein SERLA73DRAFT_189521 [Serpula lacrymans var. lacrymans S7.3]|uniref:Uncharacterized protein n=2 Tax=Serpula lacrymans var. lacrymans TaxID=341189 RepID=F8QDT8_SERL3|nr:uncharacterized protein SERLADRAFT_480363 [Serpula lacrymans var. lacrymans S7.9]EGN93759.1 hypothetical protein SERLA73DRAFT_189521 [Serpula lacrymans var. lacrymans S7.3]EGO19130.1 hypothetical protein SERLADRAFT_480363 [Serpula lacrymans var. lacrymans S7.9]
MTRHSKQERGHLISSTDEGIAFRCNRYHGPDMPGNRHSLDWHVLDLYLLELIDFSYTNNVAMSNTQKKRPSPHTSYSTS